MADQDEIIDSSIDTEETVQPEGSEGESGDQSETPEEKVARLEDTNKKLFERAKKAEGFVKDPNTGQWVKKPQAAKPQVAQPASASPINVEETVLLANGMDEELLEKLKKVAQVNGTSLIKAQNDPIFVAVKEKFEKDQKQSAASMPAARGSSMVKVKKSFDTPGLSRDEHKAMAEAAMK